MKQHKIMSMEVELEKEDLVARRGEGDLLIKIGDSVYEARRPAYDDFCFDEKQEPIPGRVIAQYLGEVSKYSKISWKNYEPGDDLDVEDAPNYF